MMTHQQNLADDVNDNSSEISHSSTSNLIALEESEHANKANQKNGTSNVETLMHVIKANIGTGVLAMPLAFKNGGLALSSISLWIMAVISIHCMHILLECYKHLLSKFVKQTDSEDTFKNIGYDDVVFLIAKEKTAANSKLPIYARFVISIFLVFAQLGFCCVYLVFVPTNLKQVIDYYYPSNTLSVQILMAVILLPLILFCLIKNLKILAPFSTFANFLMVISMIVILGELLLNGTLKPLDELDMIAPYYNWPIYFSSTIYAFEGISLVLPVYNEMKEKEHFHPFTGVLNTAMSLVAIMYFSIGFFGYMKYGHNALPSITLNLPVSSVLFQVIKILFAIAIFISYNLQFYVAANIIWAYLMRSSKYLQSLQNNSNLESSTTSKRLLESLENIFRSLLVIFTFLLAFSIPRIDLFISLVGAVASSTLAIIVPPILDLIVFWPSTNFSILKLGKNIIVILFGVYIFSAGTFVSVRDIVNYFRN